MHGWTVAFAGILLLGAAPLAAETVSAGETYFELVTHMAVSAPADVVYDAFANPGAWWSDAHTYSGDSANMTLATRADGCFCETLPDGGTIEHGRVVYAQPGQMLRLVGGLGPLQSEPVYAVLSWTLEKSGTGTRITQRYVASGHVKGGLGVLAPLVGKVLDEQLAGLARYADRKPR